MKPTVPIQEDEGRIDPLRACIDFLISEEKLTRQSLERGIRAASDGNVRLDIALNQLGLVDDDALVRAWSDVTGIPVAGEKTLPSDPPLLDLLPAAFLANARCLPVSADGERLILAVEDPIDNFTPSAVAAKTGLIVERVLATRRDIDLAIGRLKSTEAEEHSQPATALHGDSSLDAERLRDLASDAPVIRLVNDLIDTAVDLKASDIHLTALPHGSRLRYRIDGILRDVEAPRSNLHAAVVSRIKIMAGLDIAERRLPQDGRIRVGVRGREVDFRVATMPHAHGEGVVLRLLDRSSIPLDFELLGLSPRNVIALRNVLAIPHGMVLVTGPTGSGKTTTLYAALSSIRSADRNIITVEDPVEYHLDGVNQIQVVRHIGLDFASALRAVLRQDPDIIMVGEIRDRETAAVATQAALTGHLVLATVHTNNAAGALPRLVDMGVEPFLLASTLRGVLAQRLVRRICPKCHADSSASTARPDDAASAVLPPDQNCPICHGSGYQGRVTISEYLPMTDAIREFLVSGADENRIAVCAESEGMISLLNDGLEKVAAGVTSMSEVMRVTGET